MIASSRAVPCTASMTRPSTALSSAVRSSVNDWRSSTAAPKPMSATRSPSLTLARNVFAPSMAERSARPFMDWLVSTTRA